MIELAIVILVAAGLGIAARFLRQPIVLAYLATGALIGYFGLFNITDRETFQIFSDLGIMFLLFLVGLEIDYRALRLVGKASLLVGLGQVIFTFAAGFGLVHLMGFELITALYIAIALTLSSTIIVVKALSERKALNSLYGKISLGVLLAQDAVAIVALLFLAGLESGQALTPRDMITTTLAAIGLFVAILWLGRQVFPLIFRKISRSRELLFLISLGWLFFLAAIVHRIGLSIEVGGFLAGLALANSSEHYQIASRMKPLRDFFILIFFVILGSSLVLSNVAGLTTPIILLSLFVLIGNPLIIMMLMGLLGYRKRTGFLTGVTLAQISEFSLILAAIGFSIGHINEQVVALITAVGVVTITLSSYMVEYSESLFRLLRRPLALFERAALVEDGEEESRRPRKVVLIGAHRTGRSVAHHIPKEDILIVDFNPDVVDTLREHGFDVIFGDIADPDIGELAHIDEADLIISTSPDAHDNRALLEQIEERITSPDDRPTIVVRADDVDDAMTLYVHGADYVLLPYFVSGHYLSRVIASDNPIEILDHLKERDLRILRSGELDDQHLASITLTNDG